MSTLCCTDIAYSDRPAPEGTGFTRCALKFLHAGTPEPRRQGQAHRTETEPTDVTKPTEEETLRPTQEKLAVESANVRNALFSFAPQYAYRALLPAHTDGGQLHA